jgi:hypothetical protein
MKDMLWIEYIVESTLAPPFLTNSRVNMIGLVNFLRVVDRRYAFLAFPSAQNGGESKSWVENEGLKHQFSQVEKGLDFQKIPKLVSIPSKRTPKKKAIVLKNGDEKGEKVGKKLGGW